ncbi:MAG: family 10 glycosylhydrolase, partial [Clostridia bacterium]|nr:family 10 glycosylhydrolase [Clostridia bacterium]
MKNRLFAATVAAVLLAVALTSCAAKVSTSPTPLAAGDPCAPLVGLLDPDSEVRGVWIASVWNIDYPSSAYLSDDELKAEIDDIIDNCKKLSLNTVFFQVRPACDALYKSDLFPVSQFLSADGKLSFDPLEYILDKAHHNKISVHAWVNPLRVTPGAGKLDSLPKDSPARVHPEYTVDYCGRIVLNAGIPEVRDLVSEGVREIVKRYEVDGVVFDDYFYPYPQNDDSGRPVPFDDGETFTKYGGGFSDVGDFRRDSVNKLVKACYDAVKETD